MASGAGLNQLYKVLGWKTNRPKDLFHWSARSCPRGQMFWCDLRKLLLDPCALNVVSANWAATSCLEAIVISVASNDSLETSPALRRALIATIRISATKGNEVAHGSYTT